MIISANPKSRPVGYGMICAGVRAPIRHGSHFHETYLWNWLRPIIPYPTGRYI
jgi:hypothetical protein